MNLTDAWNDVELVVDLLVHRCGDDADFREGVGHGVDAHLCHQQRQQEDLVLGYVVVLGGRRGREGGGGVCLIWLHKRLSVFSVLVEERGTGGERERSVGGVLQPLCRHSLVCSM